MSIERKRQLNEVLMRRHPPKEDGSPGEVGVHIVYLSWMEEDGVKLPETMKMENPKDGDWDSPEVKELIDEVIHTSKQTVDAHVSKIADLETELAGHQDRYSELSRKLFDRETELKAAQFEIEQVKQHATDYQNQAQSNADKITELYTTIESQKNELTQLSVKHRTSDNDHQEALRIIEVHKAETQSAIEHHQETESRLSVVNNNNLQLKNDLKTLKAEASNMEIQIQSLTDTNQQLTQQVSDLKVQLSEATAE